MSQGGVFFVICVLGSVGFVLYISFRIFRNSGIRGRETQGGAGVWGGYEVPLFRISGV